MPARLSPHIALREAGLPFELVQVDLRAKKTNAGDDFLAINPKGYVPALGLPDGEVLTEGALIVQYVADQNPDARLAPRQGTKERRRLAELLHFIATELQKGIAPLNNPKANPELKEALKAEARSSPGLPVEGPRGSEVLARRRLQRRRRLRVLRAPELPKARRRCARCLAGALRVLRADSESPARAGGARRRGSVVRRLL